MKKMNNKGFSLVELIIVIAIMAILAGALAPALIKYIAKSRRSSDANNCGTIQSAMQTATSDEAADEAFAGVATNTWTKLDSSLTTGTEKDYWTVVDKDLAGGVKAFANPKTTKLVDGTKFKPDGYYWMVTSDGDVHVGIGTKTQQYECVPELDKQMGGK